MRYDVMAYYWSCEYIWWLQPVSISERCPYVGSLDYTVVLENSSGERVDQKVVSSNNCSASLCSTSFSPFSSDENYLVSVSANNIFGSSNIMTSSIISELHIATLPTWHIIIIIFIDGSLPSTYNLPFTFDSCTSSVFCSSLLDEGGCVIRYGQDPSYQDLGPPIQAPLNFSFPLPLMEATTTYYYQVTIKSSLIIQLRGNLTTGECELGYDWCCHEVIILFCFIVDVRLTTTNQVLLVVGVILWSVAFIVGIIIKVITRKGEVAPLYIMTGWYTLLTLLQNHFWFSLWWCGVF